MSIRETLRKSPAPSTPEQDAEILRQGLHKALIGLAVGAAAYVIAAILTFWRG